MEDSSTNKINVEEEEEEEEEQNDAAQTYCPYKKVTNFFGGFFNKNQPQESNSPKLSTEDNEKPKCPFGFTSSKKKEQTEKPKCPFGFTSSKPAVPKGKCPFGFGSNDNNNHEKKKYKKRRREKCFR